MPKRWHLWHLCAFRSIPSRAPPSSYRGLYSGGRQLRACPCMESMCNHRGNPATARTRGASVAAPSYREPDKPLPRLVRFLFQRRAHHRLLWGPIWGRLPHTYRLYDRVSAWLKGKRLDLVWGEKSSGRCRNSSRGFQSRRQDRRQCLAPFLCPPQDALTGFRAQKVPLRHVASLQDVRQRRLDGGAGGLRSTERQELGRRTHTRIEPALR